MDLLGRPILISGWKRQHFSFIQQSNRDIRGRVYLLITCPMILPQVVAIEMRVLISLPSQAARSRYLYMRSIPLLAVIG